MQKKPFEIGAFRREFPFFHHHPQVAYLDSTATCLKPQILLDTTSKVYASAGSVHRSPYDEENTALYEKARINVQNWLNVAHTDEIIWTSGATHAINLVAQGIAHTLQSGDEIITTFAEHHANFIPWQQLAQKENLSLHILPFDQQGIVDKHTLCQHLTPRTKIVALNWVSNVTGAVQPIQEYIRLIRQHSQAKILIDASQAIRHFPINMQNLDCDFLVFSAHKIYGPTGVGALIGKTDSLLALQPLFYGGKMANHVTPSTTLFAPLPYRLEAGTPNIAGIIAFGAVLEWWQNWDMVKGEAHAKSLAQLTRKRLSHYPNVRIFSAPNSTIISFTFTHIANFDLASLLSSQHIALRTGKHCAEPYLTQLGENHLIRISFAPYNYQQDITQFFSALDNALEVLCSTQ